MVVSGFQGGQPKPSLPLALDVAFFGWFCLLIGLACSGLALDWAEGEVMATAARWLQHAIFAGASFIALARYLSFSRRKPLEQLLSSLEGLKPNAVQAMGPRRGQALLKALRFWGLATLSLAGLAACALPVSKRLAALALVDGLWYCLALDWLNAQFRFRRSRAKEVIKETLDDLRSRRQARELPPLQLRAETPWWSKSLVVVGLVAVAGMSYARLVEEEKHVLRAELRLCLENTMARESFRGTVTTTAAGCTQNVLGRFDIRAVGIGANRKVLAQEKAGIDPLADGLPGNQGWSLSASGVLRRMR